MWLLCIVYDLIFINISQSEKFGMVDFDLKAALIELLVVQDVFEVLGVAYLGFLVHNSQKIDIF